MADKIVFTVGQYTPNYTSEQLCKVLADKYKNYSFTPGAYTKNWFVLVTIKDNCCGMPMLDFTGRYTTSGAVKKSAFHGCQWCGQVNNC